MNDAQGKTQGSDNFVARRAMRILEAEGLAEPDGNLYYRGGKVHRHVGAGETACGRGWGPLHGTEFPGHRGLEARLADPSWSLTRQPVDCLACLDSTTLIYTRRSRKKFLERRSC